MAKSILVLSSAENEQNLGHLRQFTDLLERNLGPDIEIQTAHYRDLVFRLRTGSHGFSIEPTKKNSDELSLVFFKTHIRYTEIAASAATILHKDKIPFVSSELESAISQTKLTQYARMAAAGLPIPESFYTHSKNLLSFAEEIENFADYPFICKGADSKGGDKNYLIRDLADLEKRLRANPSTEFIIQRFVPNDFDYRILVLGGQAKLVMERRRGNEGHLNNTSQGASATLVGLSSLDSSIIDDAEKAAKLMEREIAGVDILVNKETGEHVILEVNAAPQLASGAFVDEKIKAVTDYLKQLSKDA